MTRPLTTASILISLTLSAAIFGFFYAWVCSTMWGLDAADPRVAIAAMNAMNGSVRNAVFAPAFFGTPVALGLTAVLAWRQNMCKSAALFTASAGVYVALALLLTMLVNVPMNEALAATEIPENLTDAAEIWADYSSRWQLWNQIRTATSGLSFLLALLGAMAFARQNKV